MRGRGAWPTNRQLRPKNGLGLRHVDNLFGSAESLALHPEEIDAIRHSCCVAAKGHHVLPRARIEQLGLEVGYRHTSDIDGLNSYRSRLILGREPRPDQNALVGTAWKHNGKQTKNPEAHSRMIPPACRRYQAKVSVRDSSSGFGTYSVWQCSQR